MNSSKILAIFLYFKKGMNFPEEGGPSKKKNDSIFTFVKDSKALVNRKPWMCLETCKVSKVVSLAIIIIKKKLIEKNFYTRINTEMLEKMRACVHSGGREEKGGFEIRERYKKFLPLLSP